MCSVDIVGVDRGQEPLKYAAYLVWFILVVMSLFCYRTFGFTLLCSYHCSVQCLRGVSLPLVRFVLRWGHTPFMLRYFGFHRSAKAQVSCIITKCGCVQSAWILSFVNIIWSAHGCKFLRCILKIMHALQILENHVASCTAICSRTWGIRLVLSWSIVALGFLFAALKASAALNSEPSDSSLFQWHS